MASAIYQTAAEFVFSRNGNGSPCLRHGWSEPEEHATWSVGESSDLVVPVTPGTGDLMLEIAVTPFLVLPFFRRQRLTVSVNGVALGEEALEGETTVGFRLPAAQFAGSEAFDIVLGTPDATCPSDIGISQDRRRLGVALREILVVRVPPEPPAPQRVLPPLRLADFTGSDADANVVRGLTGLSPPDLMLQFESLGHNCEFGLVQRRCGAEPLGLLRFVAITTRNLLLGLDFGFEGADDPAGLHCYLDGNRQPQYLVRNNRYGMLVHTFLAQDQTTPGEVLAGQARELAVRRRAFIDMLHAGNRVFVFQRPEPMTEAQALPILTLLQSYGSNALLFVTAGGQVPAGTVRMLRRDLFQGTIDRLAPLAEPGQMNLTAWVSLCANTYRLWRENGGGS